MISQSDSEQARMQAEARFKRREIMKADGEKAWSQAEEARIAMTEKTNRLRALRLDKEEADRVRDSVIALRAPVKTKARKGVSKLLG